MPREIQRAAQILRMILSPRVAGARLCAGLTGRKGRGAGIPGLHPGLAELALQAGIARGRVGVLRDVARHAFINLEEHSWPCCFFGL